MFVFLLDASFLTWCCDRSQGQGWVAGVLGWFEGDVGGGEACVPDSDVSDLRGARGGGELSVGGAGVRVHVAGAHRILTQDHGGAARRLLGGDFLRRPVRREAGRRHVPAHAERRPDHALADQLRVRHPPGRHPPPRPPHRPIHTSTARRPVLRLRVHDLLERLRHKQVSANASIDHFSLFA
jgi:hypothetical protein